MRVAQPSGVSDRWVVVADESREVGRFGVWTEPIIGALIEVHRALGPGLLESAYEACLCVELSLRGLRFARQVPLSLEYKGVAVGCGYRPDFVVEGRVLVELKALERILPIHEAQVVTYLRLAHLAVALLVNFNVLLLKNGLRRLTRVPPNKTRPFDPHPDGNGSQGGGKPQTANDQGNQKP